MNYLIPQTVFFYLYYFQTALKTWCKIVTLLTEDYNNLLANSTSYKLFDNENNSNKTIKWNSEADVKQYLEESQRSMGWYKETDKRLHEVFIKFYKLTQHPRLKIRLELAQVCSLLIERCMKYVNR